MPLHLTHFEAAIVFSLCTSIVFAVISRNTGRERLKYGAWTFLAFLGTIVAGGWLMSLAY